jgi:hypothetical protein
MNTNCLSLIGKKCKNPQLKGYLCEFPTITSETNNGKHSLKVVGNEKEGGSGKWQMIDIGLGLW